MKTTLKYFKERKYIYIILYLALCGLLFSVFCLMLKDFNPIAFIYRDNETAHAFPCCYHSLIIIQQPQQYYVHYTCTLIYAHLVYKTWLHSLVLQSHICLIFVTSQLPSMSPWSSKDTAQISSSSSVDTVVFSLTQAGYTMGHWREVNSLALPSLVQCTQSRVIQSRE